MKLLRHILLFAALISFAAATVGYAVVVDRPTAEIISAVRSNNVELLDNLLTVSSNAEAYIRGAVMESGVTLLHIAAALNERETADYLIGRGADVNAVTAGGFTPLHWAAGRDAVDAAAVLIEHGADINAETLSGITPLHWAANNDATNVVKLLLAKGAAPMPHTVDGETPLHWAVLNDAGDAALELASRVAEDDLKKKSAEKTEPAAATNDVLNRSDLWAPVMPLPNRTYSPAAVKHPVFGGKLVVPIGFGEKLSFIWIATLRLWFGEFEVTNGQFRRFKPDHNSLFYENISLNGNEQPVVYVSWNDAREFCRWLNSNYADRIPANCEFRLPTDLEWQKVAQCGDNRIFPWGNSWPPRYGNFSDLSARAAFPDWKGIRHYDDGYPVTCPVSKSGVNEWGIYGLAGNVWEWCSDWYDTGKRYKIRRGGCWDFDGILSLRVDTRGFDLPDARFDTIGIRLVVAGKGRPIVKIDD